MKTSKRGLAEIAGHEGIVTSRYLDSVGVPTIGIGHTRSAGSPNPDAVKGELPIAEIMDIFARDIGKFEARVNRAFTRKLTQEQFDAAVSFDFNTGAIHRATWVKKFNEGKDAEAKKRFMDWRKPKEIIPRRRKERDLFFSGRYSGNGMATIFPAVNGHVQWGQGRRVNVLDLMGQKQPQTPAQRDEPPGKGIGTGIAATGALGLLVAYWNDVVAKASEFLNWIWGIFQ